MQITPGGGGIFLTHTVCICQYMVYSTWGVLGFCLEVVTRLTNLDEIWQWKVNQISCGSVHGVVCMHAHRLQNFCKNSANKLFGAYPSNFLPLAAKLLTV